MSGPSGGRIGFDRLDGQGVGVGHVALLGIAAALQRPHVRDDRPAIVDRDLVTAPGHRANAVRDGVDMPGSVVGGDEGDDDTKLFGSAGPTSRDLAMLASDKANQGLSGARLVCFAVGIELGRAPAAGEVVGVVTYKSDMRVCAVVKAQRKAGVATLSSCLDSTTVQRELNSHFSALIREYSERGLIEEASRLWYSFVFSRPPARG